MTKLEIIAIASNQETMELMQEIAVISSTWNRPIENTKRNINTMNQLAGAIKSILYSMSH